MGLTKLEIYNIALVQLGQTPITDLASTDKTVIKLNAVYNAALNSTLISQKWDFATAYADISANLVDDDLVGRFSRSYSLPADLALIRFAYTNPSGFEYENVEDNLLDYELVGDVLTTNSETVFIEYTKTLNAPEDGPTTFGEAVAFRLATLCAPSVYHNLNSTEYLANKGEERQAIASSRSRARTPYKAKLSGNWTRDRNWH